jgi:hypothetical protein
MEIHVPAMVQAILAARIDRLPGAEKEPVQTMPSWAAILIEPKGMRHAR